MPPHGNKCDTVSCSNKPIAIVRSDIGYYLENTISTHKKPYRVYQMHPSMMGGDHYMRIFLSWWIVVKGNSYRQSQDIDIKDCDPGAVLDIHPNCRGGDHYCATYLDEKKLLQATVIFQKKGKYRVVNNSPQNGNMSTPMVLSTDSNAKEGDLHDDYKDGLYFMANGSEYYVVKQVDDWGFSYYMTKDLSLPHESRHPFPIESVEFLLGGAGYGKGPSVGTWSYLKYIDNTEGNSPIAWSQEVEMKKGYNKTMSRSFEQHWENSAESEAGVEIGIFNAQIKLSATYGGSKVDASDEDWSEEKTTKETISVTVPAKSALYLWQFKFTMDRAGDLLFSKYWKTTSEDKPPTDIPSGIPRVYIEY